MLVEGCFYGPTVAARARASYELPPMVSLRIARQRHHQVESISRGQCGPDASRVVAAGSDEGLGRGDVRVSIMCFSKKTNSCCALFSMTMRD